MEALPRGNATGPLGPRPGALVRSEGEAPYSFAIPAVLKVKLVILIVFWSCRDPTLAPGTCNAFETTPMPARILLLAAILLSQLLAAILPSRALAREPLALWIHPFLTAAELTKRFTPLADYLGQKCGIPVQIEIEKSYAAQVQRVGEERFDLAYLGPAPYVQISQRYGDKILLGRLVIDGAPVFHGIIFTRKDSAIKNLQDLAGKRFAFGDPNSTMSHFVPRFILEEAGIGLEKLRDHVFLGMHQNVALGVLGGYYDAGGIKESIFRQYQSRGLKMLAESPPVPTHVFVAGQRVPPATVRVLRQALLQLQDQTLLDAIVPGATGIAPVQEKDYDFLRRLLLKYGTQKAE